MDRTSYSLKPGDTINTTNGSDRAIGIDVRMADGTLVSVTLHPGATIKVVTGSIGIDLDIKDAEGPGLALVPEAE